MSSDLKKNLSFSIDEEDDREFEKGEVDQLNKSGLQQGFKSRHIQLIALGGTIGTGLFIGSGGILSTCGPVGFLIGYCILATVIYCVMNQLGVMVTYLPKEGAVSDIAARYVDPSLGFATGAIYIYTLLIFIPAEISAAVMIIQYWTDKVPVAVWIVVMIGFITLLNLAAVKYYAETEFWFASLKIFLILGLIILGFVIFFGGGPNQHGVQGFRFWKTPGPFVEHLSHGSTGRFCDVWTALIKSGFAFIIGPELVSVTAAETQNPRRNISKAARRFVWRLMFFYCMSAFIIGILVPSNNKELLNGSSSVSASPFVIGIHNVGIKGLNHVINAVVLTSALSAGNSFFYAGSRYLYNMALKGQTPVCFTYTWKNGVPYWCCAFSTAVSCLSFLNVSSSTANVFNWFSNMTTISGFIGWVIVGISFIRFRKAIIHNGLEDRLPYKPILAPYTAYYSVGFIGILTITNGYAVFFNFNAADFIAAYLTLPFFGIFYFGHKTYTKNWMLARPIEEIDVISGLEEAEEEEIRCNEMYKPADTIWGRAVDWVL